MSSESTNYDLQAENELRFEIDIGSSVTVTLINGTAELFGTELAKNKSYRLEGQKVGIFSWHGCKIEVKGHPSLVYLSESTPMLEYVNTHMALEKMREKVKNKSENGPRILVIGGEDVGKSTLCRILANYAVRRHHKPILVDLDVNLGVVGVPGTLGALLLERPVDIEDGYPMISPLIFHYGRFSALENLTLYKHLIQRLAKGLELRCEKDPNTRSSGFIINTPAWADGDMNTALLHAVDSFGVDVILVLDNERLFQTLKQKFSGSKHVVRLSKSGGVVSRSKAFRQSLRDKRTKEYFYGTTGQLYPHSTVLKFNDFKIFKFGAPPVPLSCLPIGEVAEDNEKKLHPILFDESLVYHLLSVSNSDNDEDEENPVLDANVLGFVYVSAIDTARNHFTVLSPAPGQIPKNILLYSSYKTQIE